MSGYETRFEPLTQIFGKQTEGPMRAPTTVDIHVAGPFALVAGAYLAHHGQGTPILRKNGDLQPMQLRTVGAADGPIRQHGERHGCDAMVMAPKEI